MTQSKPSGSPGVYFVETDGILIDNNNESITLILNGKGIGYPFRNGDTALKFDSPEAIETARKQCIEQIDILDQKMREFEEASGQLRFAYQLLSERKRQNSK